MAFVAPQLHAPKNGSNRVCILRSNVDGTRKNMSLKFDKFLELKYQRYFKRKWVKGKNL